MNTLAFKVSPSSRDLLSLIKPGIVLANLVSVTGGFGLAARGQVVWSLLDATLWGAALILSAGCVFNNLVDRDIDSFMQRTRQRPLAQGRITSPQALTWGTLLLGSGAWVLGCHTNLLTLAVSLTGIFVYVGLYSLYFKRRSWLGVWVGSIAGAIPPLMGYTAVTHHLGPGAWCLFLIFCLWQIPHAHAIALLHLEDYRRAGLHLLPLTHGEKVVRQRMPYYISAFLLASLLPFFYDLTGLSYLLVVLTAGGGWLCFTWKTRHHPHLKSWARGHFLFSILTIMILNFMLVLDPTLLFRGS
ncbi:heme o synthase [Ferrovum sp.]|uniref:heme o synthase n=1 Tax=Ferrovum sp. TaxID=2609467 RepID=UPI0026289F59|nr:heme o synthase [Ferrovum sp.]